MSKNDRIYVAGHRGLVGSALINELRNKGFCNLLTRTRSELDLLNKDDVKNFFAREKPDIVFLAAAKVGGIHANNTFRADFLYENMQIQSNVIWSAHENNVHRFIFLGSSCIYPRNSIQPIKEEYLLSGKLEYTNQPYAIAKIAGLELINCLRKQFGRDYFSVMPTNLFGPNDNFHPENSHVLAALIRKFCEAKIKKTPEVIVWGDGSPLREFMYSEDLASALCFLAENISYDDFENSSIGHKNLSHINVGTGFEISIRDLAKVISIAAEYEGKIIFDSTKLNGTPRKLMDSSVLQEFGWKSNGKFEENIMKEVKYYVRNMN